MATLRIVVVLVIVAVVAAAFITVIVATVVVASAASRCHNMATFSLRMNRCISFHFVLCLCYGSARLSEAVCPLSSITGYLRFNRLQL